MHVNHILLLFAVKKLYKINIKCISWQKSTVQAKIIGKIVKKGYYYREY